MKGFSLVEMTVVVLVAGIVALIALPVFRDVLPSARAESGARRISAAVNRLYNEAVFTGITHSLLIDIGDGSYKGFVEFADGEPERVHGTAGQLPAGIEFLDAEVAGRRFDRGEVKINFSPHGVIDASVIRIADEKGNNLSIVIEGFTGSARIVEGYATESFIPGN